MQLSTDYVIGEMSLIYYGTWDLDFVIDCKTRMHSIRTIFSSYLQVVI